MDAVFGVLRTASDVVTGTASLIVELLGRFGVLLFMAGFFGLLFTFLWFIFRYIDKRRLALPTIVFTLFFIVFLSGNILMLAQDAHTRNAAPERIETEQAELSPGETAV